MTLIVRKLALTKDKAPVGDKPGLKSGTECYFLFEAKENKYFHWCYVYEDTAKQVAKNLQNIWNSKKGEKKKDLAISFVQFPHSTKHSFLKVK